MTPDTVCPRCGHRNSFLPSALPGTCVCAMCESQLDWRRIPNCGPDCRPLNPSEPQAEEESKPPVHGVQPAGEAEGPEAGTAEESEEG